MNKMMLMALLITVGALGIHAETKAVRTVETTIMQAPVIGKITTHKLSYYSECVYVEHREIKFHNALAALFSDDRKVKEGSIYDNCNEVLYDLDYGHGSYDQKSYREVIQEESEDDEEDHDDHIVVESDGKPPVIKRSIAKERETINGLKARKVTTLIMGEEGDKPLVMQEWYARKLPGADIREDVLASTDRALKRDREQYHGIPDFIQAFMDAVKEEGVNLEEVPGYLIRAEIHLDDDDGDPIFFLNYNLDEIERLDVKNAVFEIPADLSRSD